MFSFTNVFKFMFLFVVRFKMKYCRIVTVSTLSLVFGCGINVISSMRIAVIGNHLH